MFIILNIKHPAWSLASGLFISMLFFIAIVSIIVFLLRGWLRKYKPADLFIFKKLQPLHTKSNDNIMLAITLLGKHQFLIPANLLLIFIFLIFKNQHHYAISVLLVSLSCLLLMFILKHLFRRNRPSPPLIFKAKGKSFPSGHAMMSVCFYGLLLHMLLLTGMGHFFQIIVIIFTVLLILIIGFSRVYLQVHYLSDVLAGFIIGTCWFYICLHELERIQFLLK